MQRYNELDSLRGLAAFSVFVAHIIGIFPFFDSTDNWISIVIAKSPLHIFWAGHEAVILFFVLSGFVLFLPFSESLNFNYLTYAIKRFFRIYIPYVVAILLTVAIRNVVYHGTVDGSTSWFNNLWLKNFTLDNVIDHIIFLGSFSHVVNGVTWSLVHEMRISLIFPLLAYLVIRLSWKQSFPIAITISLAGAIISKYITPDIDYFVTLRYILMFVTGALLAKHRLQIHKIYSQLNKKTKYFLLLIGIILYSYAYWGYYPVKSLHSFDDWITTIGASIFIVLAFSSKTASRLLLKAPIHFVGKISYSFYLYHLIVLLSLVHLFNDSLPLWITLILVVIATFMLSTASYYLVELPSIRLGKLIIKNKVLRRKIDGRTMQVK